MRLDRHTYSAVSIEDDGACLWRALAHFHKDLTFDQIRDLICDSLLSHGGQRTWRGFTQAAWVEYELDMDWDFYVQELRDGTIWAGALEMLETSVVLNVEINTFIGNSHGFRSLLCFKPPRPGF